MNVFILGRTKTGKSTLAKALLKSLETAKVDCALYEAGAWARKGFAKTEEAMKFNDELDPAFKEALTAYAKQMLTRDTQHSFKAYQSWCKESGAEIQVIVGVRSPDDFVAMVQSSTSNFIVRLADGAEQRGSLGVMETGLAVIDNYVTWKLSMGHPNIKSQMVIPDKTVFSADLVGSLVSQILD